MINFFRKHVFLFLVSLIVPTVCFAHEHHHHDDENSMLTYAIAWKQTAAEYRALSYQAYNVARMQLDIALQNHKKGDKPLAIATDVDDTIIDSSNYWGYLIFKDLDFFDDDIWDEWIPENKFKPMPGALDFFRYADSKGVKIFYISNRDQGEKSYEYAFNNLKFLNFPQVKTDQVIIQRETSNKEVPQNKIAEKYNIVLKLGDNLNDFQRKYYVKNVEERMSLMEEDKHKFGKDYILLPNPTEGHWIRAIFGTSEPEPTNENRKIFKDAAMYSIWKKN